MIRYARISEDKVVEIIDSVFDEGGNYIPIEVRYAPDFVSSLVDVSNLNPQPEQSDTYKDGVFSKPSISGNTPSKQDCEVNRLIAYSDPVYGSDRYFMEVLSLQAEGFAATSVEVKDAKAKGLARKLAIKSLYPYPDK